MKAKGQDDQIKDWSDLLKATLESGGEMRGAGPFVEALEESHDHAVSLRSRRDALLESAMELTVQMNVAFAEGRDAARALRSYIKSALGPRSERLARFGIKALPGRRGGGNCR